MAANVNPDEIWQVDVAGQVYEAPLRELPEWIEEGSLQPDDLVRKGVHRWAKARNVPTLIPFFNAREKGEPMPLFLSSTNGSAADPVQDPGPTSVNATASTSATIEPPSPSVTERAIVSESAAPKSTPQGLCWRHPHENSFYFCSSCSGEFCRACPNSFGGTVRLCPLCGSLCKPVREAVAAAQFDIVVTKHLNEPFGFVDLGRAFGFPWKFRSSLILGGAMFLAFTLGQSASSIGGFLFVGAALVCAMLANMLTFGSLINTISNFTQGRLENDFLPSFDDFSLWDDVVHPFFLSIAAYLSSFGPLFLTAMIGLYLVTGAIAEQRAKFENELSQVPGTPLYAPDRTMEQSKDVQDLLSRVREANERRLRTSRERTLRETGIAETGSPQPSASDAPADTYGSEAADLEMLVNERGSGFNDPAETIGTIKPEADPTSVVLNILSLAAPLVVIAALALLWGLIYFPAACAVAGYSRSFISTINPLVGIDTMWRMGTTYIKILAMCAVLAAISIITGAFLHLVLMPFNLPWIGNIPAIAVSGFITFYLWIVFCCILGYALFKSSEKLKLVR